MGKDKNKVSKNSLDEFSESDSKFQSMDYILFLIVSFYSLKSLITIVFTHSNEVQFTGYVVDTMLWLDLISNFIKDIKDPKTGKVITNYILIANYYVF